MIDLKAFENLATVPLDAFHAKATTLTEGQQEASTLLWSSPDGNTRIGVWECTPGRFTADRTAAGEYCLILSGRAEVTNADGGGSRLIGAGDLLVLPQGWIGEWEIVEHIRKIYVVDSRVV
jgi:hypothetical protein